jgi:hypothetical protein
MAAGVVPPSASTSAAVATLIISANNALTAMAINKSAALWVILFLASRVELGRSWDSSRRFAEAERAVGRASGRMGVIHVNR